MHQAFRCGIYSSSVGFTLKIGDNSKQLVVLSGVFIGTGELLGGLFQITLSGFTERRKYGKCVVLGTGLVCQLITFTIICLNIPATAVFGNTLDESFIHPRASLAMLCSILIGFSDCCCHTQMYSIMAVMFPENSSQTCAIYKFTKGIMVAVTFYCSSYLNLHQQLAVLAPMALIANLTFFKVNKTVMEAAEQAKNDYNLEKIKYDLSNS
ncbi:UNC93-like protein MFSD11 [Homalodisca vitripennis]|nr:UNC93-like protein MFSD11 [Homalodisca vitripennis]